MRNARKIFIWKYEVLGKITETKLQLGQEH